MPVGPWEHGGGTDGAVQRVQKDNGLLRDLMGDLMGDLTAEFVGVMAVSLELTSLERTLIDCSSKIH